MLRGLYISANGMILQRHKMDTITNNIAHVDTTGYRKDFMVSRTFPDMLISRINDPSVVNVSRNVGPLNGGARIDRVTTSYEQGSMDVTENPSDMAIAGNGFFTILTPSGEQYTRDGSFKVNSQGYLVTNDGNFVVGRNGLVIVGTDGFSVDASGNITVGGQVVNQLKIVDFADKTWLKKVGDNLFAGEGAVDAAGYDVKQGYLEASNVDIARETVDMLETYRTYETNQRILTMIDGTFEKACNELGRL